MSKIGDFDFMPQLDAALVGNFFEDAFHQSRFAFAVAAHKGHFFTPAQAEVHVTDNQVFAVGFAQLFDNYRKAAAAGSRGKAQIQMRIILLVHFDSFHFFELLNTRLHLDGFGGFVAKAFNKGFGILNLFLLVFVAAQLLFPHFFAKLNKTGIG
ncbi:MAG: hypothetical protein BWX77_00242 [Bacteroidetes bacterium ADurb.Bin090]|nr:MAG: hypothetical protein BWX77_00242 [Bacteroidetes bacterium ADurb.Bin090]